MRSLPFAIAAALVLNATSSGAQVVADTTDEDRVLAFYTKKFGLDAALGNLRQREMGPDDVELRFWGSYFFANPTAVIVRRQEGQWSAWLVKITSCDKWVPSRIADTASKRTIAGYQDEARKDCARPSRPSGGAYSTHRRYYIDTVLVAPIATPQTIERAWNMAVENGVLSLPRKWPPNTVQLDGVGYMVEVRRGNEYHTSHISAGDGCGTEDVARRVRAIDKALNALLPPERARGLRC